MKVQVLVLCSLAFLTGLSSWAAEESDGMAVFASEEVVKCYNGTTGSMNLADGIATFDFNYEQADEETGSFQIQLDSEVFDADATGVSFTLDVAGTQGVFSLVINDENAGVYYYNLGSQNHEVKSRLITFSAPDRVVGEAAPTPSYPFGKMRILFKPAEGVLNGEFKISELKILRSDQ